jgi:hypothetical protein
LGQPCWELNILCHDRPVFIQAELVMKKYLAAIIVFLICQALASQEPVYDVIYAINFFDGSVYNSTIVPYSAPEICIQADSMNAFVVRETLLYYWSLTSEFKADWASRNIPLAGTLCVQNRSGKIQRIESQRYIIQYDIKDIPGTIGIYWGTEADTKHESFVKAQRVYSDSVYQYNTAMRLYEQELNAYLQSPPAVPESFPSHPLPPVDFTLLSTDVNIGFPVNLPQGQYTIYFEDSRGEVMIKTKRRLRVFSPLGEVGGFRVFEEGRWTVPADFPDSHTVLFTIPGANIYLQPYDFLHYRSSDYNLMLNPQNRYNRNESSLWIPVSLNSTSDRMHIGAETLFLSGYKVAQLAGSKLGYVITPLSIGDTESSFSAFNMQVPQNAEGKTYSVGKTSIISVLRIFSGMEIVMIFISLAPLIFFGLISIFRNRKKEI